MLTQTPLTEAAKTDVPPSVDVHSYERFVATFPLQGDHLYQTIFDAHRDVIQTQKSKFAVANLEKILSATFEISARSGFSRMSLRDLSRTTGMSMGAIYSCIAKKEDIVLMVATVVRLSSELTRRHAGESERIWPRLEQIIRFHLYVSTLLQPWYFFLYFETRSLPEGQQKVSTRIELDAIAAFTQQIQAGVESGEFVCETPRAVANGIVVMLEDWYLKPWKMGSSSSQTLSEQHQSIESYYQDLISMIRSLLRVNP